MSIETFLSKEPSIPLLASYIAGWDTIKEVPAAMYVSVKMHLKH